MLIIEFFYVIFSVFSENNDDNIETNDLKAILAVGNLYLYQR